MAEEAHAKRTLMDATFAAREDTLRRIAPKTLMREMEENQQENALIAAMLITKFNTAQSHLEN